MASGQLDLVLRHLHALVNAERAGELTDAELVRQFAAQRDETAFAALVHRHGPLVLSVCRRLLHDYHEAEDAFQATFLVLARKAAGIHQPELVVSWLHKVAYRMAIKALAESARRREQEKQVCPMRPPKPDTELTFQELRLVLDEELQLLPEKYQAPLMLCYLEGKSHAEAARHLGWPLGTIKGRLARARELLRTRLTRRGMALSAGSLTAVLPENTAPAATLPAGLMASTVRAAIMFSVGKATTAGGISAKVAALAEGTIRAMVATKVKASVMLVVAVGFLAVGGGLGGYHALGAKPEADAKPQAAEAVGPEKPPVEGGGPGVDNKQARTDFYGDPLPPGAIARLGTIQLRHDGMGHNNSAFSPDGKMLATGGGGSIRLWDPATGNLLRLITEDSPVGSVLFSRDGKSLAISGEKVLCLRDPASGRLLQRLATDGYAQAFSPDSKLLAASGSPDGSVDLWETSTGQKRFELKGHSGAFTPDGRTVVTMSREKKIRWWDVATGMLRKSVEAAVPDWRTMQFSPDAKTLAVVPYSLQAVGLWDTETGKERVRLQGKIAHSKYGLTFSADGKTLATNWWEDWAAEGTVSLWDTSTGKLIRRFQAPTRAISFLVLAPDARTLTGGGPRIYLWDTAAGKELFARPGHEDRIDSLAFTPDGKHLVSSAETTVRLWETSSGRHLRVVAQNPQGVSGFALTPDGRAVLSGGYTRLQLNELATGRELRSFVLDEHPEKQAKIMGVRPGYTALRVSLSEDGRSAVSLSYVARQVRPNHSDSVSVLDIWDLAAGKAVARREMGFSGDFHFLGFGPGLRTLAGSISPVLRGVKPQPVDESTTNQLVIQDVLTGRQLLTMPLPGYFTFDHAFSPDGRTLVTATVNMKNTEPGPQTLRFWELATGQERLSIRATEAGWEHHLAQIAFMRDGRALATARHDGIMQLWDAVTGKELFRRTVSTSPITALAISPDGKALITGHSDSTILVWDLSAAQKPASLISGKPGKKEIEGWWSDLAGSDAAKAYTAMWSLAARPSQAVPMLRDRLQPAKPVPAAEGNRLIVDLDDKDFNKREAASRRLTEFGEQIEPLLEAALKAKPSIEQQRRIGQLLTGIHRIQSPEQLRVLRAIELLEHVGTREAQDVLTTLAKGAPEARVTREAKASLERLAKRAAARP